MPIVHPKPTLRTVKELYACAIKCGFPSCEEPLFVSHPNEGPRSLNSKIAHICARREGGPRWDATMTAEENRSASNLILMCAKHADEIDMIPRVASYPVSLLRAWKKTQIAEYDQTAMGVELTDDEAADVLARSEVMISLMADTINLGGAGGTNGGSGGGGAAIGPGAIGGNGGPSGRIDLDGKPGSGPGSGGGGGGVVAAGAIPRGRDSRNTAGIGYSLGTDGNHGGDTVISFGGRELLRARGGSGGLSGTGVRSSHDRLRVSALLLVNYGEQRDGLVSLLGGGWTSYSILNLPAQVAFPYVVIFEAGGIPELELTAAVEIADPDGRVRATERFPVTVQKAGDALRIPRLGCVTVEVDGLGLWSVTVTSDQRELARIDLSIKRIGEE